MKKIIPLVIAVLCIVIFIGVILKNEQHLNHSQSIFIELKPVDPRSLIQGDYMVLNYDMYFSDIPIQIGRPSVPLHDTVIENQSEIMAYVALDAQHRVWKSSLDPRLLELYPLSSRIMLQNPRNRLNRLYPASNSYLFAEGLAGCYRNAQYAEFKVDQQGKAMLASLRNKDLKLLGCENRKKWWHGEF